MTELELTIQDLSRSGPGVAREPSGRVIFVPFTAPGDRVRVRILHEKKRFAEAELLEVLERSPIRQLPPCPVFGQCGGCQWQHLPYDYQWKTKVSGVLHALGRVQIAFPTERAEQLPAEKIWHYRNRVQLRGFRDELGFYAPRSHQLIPVEKCEIAREEINCAWPSTRQEGSQLPLPYKVEVEVLEDGQLTKHWNTSHAAGGFRQVHDEQNRKLRDWISSALTPGSVALDLFGGSGNFSHSLTPLMKNIHCVDVSAPVQRPATTPPNLSFHAAPVLRWLLKAARNPPWTSIQKPTKLVAILDPPRAGLGDDLPEIAAALEKLGVQELVLVGCDPDQWARDLSRFLRRGGKTAESGHWKLERIGVLDLFPQTSHVESLALLVL